MMTVSFVEVLGILVCSIIGIVHGADYKFKFTGNPLVTHISAADPDAHVWNGTVWVYCSMDANLRDYGLKDGDEWTYAYMDGYHAFSTTDMINWVDHGEVYHSRNVPWGPSGWMWAPAAAWRNGKYYLYYPHKDWEGVWRVGVAVAPSPTGPFKDIGAPIAYAVGIDPFVVIDNGGVPYLYFNSAQVAKLKDNMIELAEAPRIVNYGAEGIQEDYRFEEGSSMHKKGGVYYYSYSNWKALKTTAYYGTGTSPYGPFEWKGALSGPKSGSQDHHSIIQFKGIWYYFYHMDTPWQDKNNLGWYGQRRIMCYERMFYNADGTIQMVNPTSLMVNSGGSPYTAGDGTPYKWDNWYSSGSSTYVTDASISGTNDDALYQTERYGSSFSYDVPLTNGMYTVLLKFAEIYHGSVGERKFNVKMEGKQLITDLDIFSLVGKNAAYDVSRVVNVTDNELNILFSAVIDNAKVSAVKIVRIKS